MSLPELHQVSKSCGEDVDARRARPTQQASRALEQPGLAGALRLAGKSTVRWPRQGKHH